jgi:phage/plasmid-associated DNA primase
VELSIEGKFYVPDAVLEASKKTVSGGNQIAEFLTIVEFGPYEISQGELFDVYIRWCRAEGHSPAMSSVKLTDEVVRLSKGLKRTVIKSAKASSYEPQFWIDDRGDRCQVRKAMKKNGRPPTVQGLRIGEQTFGLPIGQDMPESNRIGHLFEAAPSPVMVSVDEPVAVK